MESIKKPNHKATAIRLIVEKGEDGQYWGRCNIDDDLLVESAANQEELEAKMQQLAYEFYGVNPETIVWEVEYDLQTFFESFDYLKISKIAELADINSSLVRQYASGIKYPSAKQVKKLEGAIRQLGQRLTEVTLAHESV
ncbi:MAG: hypothetical protein MUE30_11990 [Spirosomaceae bacterium]|jgi:hypothetical protein|nr:hypothetical protein [Spirosomataceae bacterium]